MTGSNPVPVGTNCARGTGSGSPGRAPLEGGEPGTGNRGAEKPIRFQIGNRNHSERKKCMRPFLADLAAVSDRVCGLAVSMGVQVASRSAGTAAAEKRFEALQAAYEAGHALHDEVAEALADLEKAWTAEVHRAAAVPAPRDAFDELFAGVGE